MTTVRLPLGTVERRLLEVLIDERTLAEVLYAIGRIYADRMERFGGAAGESYDEGQRLAAALNEMDAELRAEYATVLAKVAVLMTDGAEEAQRSGL